MSDAAPKEIPRIVSARWDRDDGHTLKGYRDSGGYEGLRAALRMESSSPSSPPMK